MDTFYQSICEEYAKTKNFSGVCLIKCGADTLFSGAYGYANRAFKIPNRMDTRFDVASITKIFTAAAVLLLVKRGMLKLDDRITETLDLRGTTIPRDVQLRHLLNHTSGIADDADEESGENYSDLFIDHPNYAVRNCADFLKNFAYKKPYFKAGTDVRYNNCAFILLGLAIEKVTGMDCRDFMTQAIFDACGMSNTRFLAMDEVNENTAEGYIPQFDSAGACMGFKKNIYCYPPIGTPDGGVYTTVDDLNAFMRAMIKNELLGEGFGRELLSVQSRFARSTSWNRVPNTRIRYGYAFEFVEIDGEIFSVFKDGMNDGVAAIFAYYPKMKITVSILSNHSCNIWQMHREIQTEIYNRHYSVI